MKRQPTPSRIATYLGIHHINDGITCDFENEARYDHFRVRITTVTLSSCGIASCRMEALVCLNYIVLLTSMRVWLCQHSTR